MSDSLTVAVNPTRSFRETRAQALRRFMQLGQWYSQGHLAEIGGSRFPARLFEIVRDDPRLAYDAVCRDELTGRFEYRLRLRGVDEPRPVTRRSRVKQLEAELEALREELRWFRSQAVAR